MYRYAATSQPSSRGMYEPIAPLQLQTCIVASRSYMSQPSSLPGSRQAPVGLPIHPHLKKASKAVSQSQPALSSVRPVLGPPPVVARRAHMIHCGTQCIHTKHKCPPTPPIPTPTLPSLTRRRPRCGLPRQPCLVGGPQAAEDVGGGVHHQQRALSAGKHLPACVRERLCRQCLCEFGKAKGVCVRWYKRDGIERQVYVCVRVRALGATQGKHYAWIVTGSALPWHRRPCGAHIARTPRACIVPAPSCRGSRGGGSLPSSRAIHTWRQWPWGGEFGRGRGGWACTCVWGQWLVYRY